MYNTDKIIEAIADQVGFERSFAVTLAPSLLVSKTGITYNQGHPLVGYKNLLSAIEEVEDTQYPIFSVTTAYQKDDVVRVDAQLWQALEAVAAGPMDESKWEKTNTLSIILKQIRNAAAAEVVSAMMTNKQIAGKGKAIWENLKLFEGAGSLQKTIPKENRFVGFELDMHRLKDLAIRLHAIGLQLTSSQASLPIYIYHTSRSLPVFTETLANVGSGTFSWHRLGKLLKHVDETVDAGGSWIIGYRESELSGFAISKEDYHFDRPPCRSCSGYNVMAHQKWSQYVSINPFTVVESAIGENGELWDTDLNRYNYNTNFGINLALSLECEITDTVVNNAGVFAEAQKLAVVEKILQLYVANTRNNADAQMMRQLADYELNNRENHTDGLTKKKEKVMKALDFNMSDLNSLCFPGKDTRLTKEPM